jgi:hypothetical protein
VETVFADHPHLAERAERIWRRLVGARLSTAAPGAGTGAHNHEEIPQ